MLCMTAWAQLLLKGGREAVLPLYYVHEEGRSTEEGSKWQPFARLILTIEA